MYSRRPMCNFVELCFFFLRDFGSQVFTALVTPPSLWFVNPFMNPTLIICRGSSFWGAAFLLGSTFGMSQFGRRKEGASPKDLQDCVSRSSQGRALVRWWQIRLALQHVPRTEPNKFCCHDFSCLNTQTPSGLPLVLLLKGVSL